MELAVAVFVVALAVIALEWVHRTKVAMLGAAAVVISQTIDQDEAIGAIDFNTIGLLAGMMLIVKVTEPTGVYNYLAIRAGQDARSAL
jgi:Na+/H+ antiporter NhaD/arsenite permease-like protein